MSFLEELPIKKTKLVISTIKKFEENMIILKTLKYHHPSLIVILVSHHVEESIKLYEEGADYVIMPHFLGAYHASLMLEEYGFDIEKFSHIRNNQVNELRSKHKDMMIEALHSGRRSKE
ncbi:NAD-binding protein [Patescibacteria group bacterium]|nr:NAD-binding protein [Patescibacteria group bacterium]MBU1758063.1 NAD-binding protein [Patescibacteria group bacterium]